MYTREFVRRVSDQTHLSERLISEVLTASIKVVRESLKSGQQVRFPGFGVFYTRQQPKGKLKSIRTGKMIDVAARRVAAFRVGATLKKAVLKK